MSLLNTFSFFRVLNPLKTHLSVLYNYDPVSFSFTKNGAHSSEREFMMGSSSSSFFFLLAPFIEPQIGGVTRISSRKRGGFFFGLCVGRIIMLLPVN